MGVVEDGSADSGRRSSRTGGVLRGSSSSFDRQGIPHLPRRFRLRIPIQHVPEKQPSRSERRECLLRQRRWCNLIAIAGTNSRNQLSPMDNLAKSDPDR